VERAYREHGIDVWRCVLVATAGRADIADDATAEAFARALRSQDVIRDPVAWVYRVALRVAARESMRQALERADADNDVAAPAPSAGMSDELRRALGRLSIQQRTAVFLHYHADLPVNEIARRMGTTQPTVRVHLHRGRRRLAQLLREEARDA
jgi:RNA polymerase sigma-70 factor, ECF subfamily